MISEILNIIRRLGDYCTVNFQKLDHTQIASSEGIYRKVPKIEPYGVRSHIPAGTRGFNFAIGGELGDSVLLGVLSEYFARAELLEGELELYTNLGTRILLNQAGGVVISPAESQPVTINGDLVVTGNVSDANGSMQEMRDTYNSHTHAGDSGGTTGNPNQSMT